MRAIPDTCCGELSAIVPGAFSRAVGAGIFILWMVKVDDY